MLPQDATVVRLCVVTVLLGLATRLQMARLYLCTDTRAERGDLAEFLEAAFAGGVDIVQIREKGLDRDAELAALDLARTIANRHQGLVCVNDSPAIAQDFSADVLHVGQDDTEPKVARRSLHQWALIGRSTHDEAQAREAAADPEVNYFCVGPVYATPTKPDYRPAGLDLVRFAARHQPVGQQGSKPWFAIGGIDQKTLGDVIAAGARRAVVVRAITEAKDPRAAAAALRSQLDETWENDPTLQQADAEAMNASFEARPVAPKAAPVVDPHHDRGYGRR